MGIPFIIDFALNSSYVVFSIACVMHWSWSAISTHQTSFSHLKFPLRGPPCVGRPPLVWPLVWLACGASCTHVQYMYMRLSTRHARGILKPSWTHIHPEASRLLRVPDLPVIWYLNMHVFLSDHSCIPYTSARDSGPLFLSSLIVDPSKKFMCYKVTSFSYLLCSVYAEAKL